MQQSSIFGKLNFGGGMSKDEAKKLESLIAQKANKPKKSRTTTVVGTAGGRAGLFEKLQTIKTMAEKYLVDDGTCICITNEMEYYNYMTKAKRNGKLAIDTETKGLNVISDEMVGLCLYTPGEKAAYVPLGHTDLQGNLIPGQLDAEILKKGLQGLENVKLIFHNAKFDIRVIRWNLGVYLFPYWDTSLAANFLNENESHELKPLWNKYCGKDDESPELKTFGQLFKGVTFNFIPLEIAKIYGAKDPKVTYELYEFQEKYLNPANPLSQKKLLAEAGKLFMEIEMPLIPVICDMEDKGIEIDEEYANELTQKYTKLLKDAERKIHSLLQEFDIASLPLDVRSKLSNPINISSPTQLAIIIYDLLGLKSPDNRKPRGTGEEILEGISHQLKQTGIDEAQKVVKFFDAILDYRGNAKLLSTYIEKMPKEVNPKTLRLHGSFNQYGAKTGRFSSSDPNLQNIPSHNKDIRKMFRAKKGYVFVSGDYSQQEPRVLAHISGDPGLIKAYAEGKDLYGWLASIVYELPYEQCLEFLPDGTKNPEGKKRRASMKNVALGLMYGRGINSVAEQLEMTYAQAEALVNTFFNRFPKIKETIEYWQEYCKKHGYVQTVWGRKRRLPDLQLPKYEVMGADGAKLDKSIQSYYLTMLEAAKDKNKIQSIKNDAAKRGVKIKDNGGKIAEAGRQVLNSIIQGSSADITKKAMLAIGNDKILKDLGFYLLLTVHDEVIGECPEENALKAAKRLSEIMIAATTDKMEVKMKVDCEINRMWYGEEITEELEAKYGKAS